MDNQINQYDNGGGNRGNTPGGNNGNGGGNGNEPQKPNILMLILWGISLIAFVVLIWNLFSGNEIDGEQVPYNEFLKYVEEECVE